MYQFNFESTLKTRTLPQQMYIGIDTSNVAGDIYEIENTSTQLIQ